MVKQLSKYYFFDKKNWIPVSRTGMTPLGATWMTTKEPSLKSK
ncbi:hypothetical protein HET73_05920 [Wolbachia endosymbiont of Atemnus politus]|nr:WPE palindromic element domain-containing protein [Wolbachia endosymbiont of Atemnus politus]NSM56889.1 hypothetical protein [Wolbachia endosymbiont of Atemnus politus]